VRAPGIPAPSQAAPRRATGYVNAASGGSVIACARIASPVSPASGATDCADQRAATASARHRRRSQQLAATRGFVFAAAAGDCIALARAGGADRPLLARAAHVAPRGAEPAMLDGARNRRCSLAHGKSRHAVVLRRGLRRRLTVCRLVVDAPTRSDQQRQAERRKAARFVRHVVAPHPTTLARNSSLRVCRDTACEEVVLRCSRPKRLRPTRSA
jgi:hypothetical protein